MIEIVSEERKTATFWISNTESSQTALKVILEDKCSIYKEKGFSIGIFYSGREDIYANTFSLLRHNRQKIIMDEILEEKNVAMT